MSKRKKSGLKSRCIAVGRRRQVAVATAVALSLIGACTMLASSGALDSAFSQKATNGGTVSLASFNSNSPSKEYVYAGGRLLATEECSYSISPADVFYSQGGAAGIVNLIAGAGCPWTASSNNPNWLTISSATSGSGSQQIGYVVMDNGGGVPRQGTLTIAGLTFTVTQEVLTGQCAYSISPTSAGFSASGGIGSVSVFTEGRCAWQAVSNADWVTVTSGCCGIGNGTVSYSVKVNTGIARTTTITIGDKIFTVKQKFT